MFGSSLPQVVCRRSHVLFTLFVLFAYSGVNTYCVFCYIHLPLCLVYPMLSVSLDCPFLLAPSIFSNVYLLVIYLMVSPRFVCVCVCVCVRVLICNIDM